jgi:hypothetical protein
MNLKTFYSRPVSLYLPLNCAVDLSPRTVYIAVILCSSIREVLGLNLSRVTDNPEALLRFT